ncbi:MAG: hypothetical protein ACOYI2_11420 [Bacillota bacterium]
MISIFETIALQLEHKERIFTSPSFNSFRFDNLIIKMIGLSWRITEKAFISNNPLRMNTETYRTVNI